MCAQRFIAFDLDLDKKTNGALCFDYLVSLTMTYHYCIHHTRRRFFFFGFSISKICIGSCLIAYLIPVENETIIRDSYKKSTN